MNDHLSDSPFAPSTFVELLRRKALQHPQKDACIFLVDGEVEGDRLTYYDLDRQARAIGAFLQHRVQRGARALLVYPSGLEFIVAFFGCLYAGVVAVPTYPPQTRTKRSQAKLRTIINDAQPAVVLTISSLSPIVEGLFVQAQDLQAIPRIATDSIADNLIAAWQDPHVDSNTLAFLQYTSGSTGIPKGVMLKHGNLLHNVSLICRHMELTSESRVVTWLPLYHDMGLIGTILSAIYAGTHTTIMSPVAFLQRPFRWLKAISNTRATHSGAPNFAYDLCVRKIAPELKATIDLSSWEMAFNGAEPVRPETMERFAETFGPCGFRPEAFYPCYGLAEATLLVAGGRKKVMPVVRTFQAAALGQNRVVEEFVQSESSRKLVGCGQVVMGQRIAIVDPEFLTQCLPGRVGEIWVVGPSIAQGYWQKPEETKHTLQAYLSDIGEGPFLRTGDLGFLHNDELFVTGRLKDLIIIRGHNHYPQDIELTVEQSHTALRPGSGVAFSVDALGEERLVIVQEVERHYRNFDVDELVSAIRQAVAVQHELQVYAVALVKMGSIPKTSSGKIQRRACREGFLARTLDVVGEWVLPPEENEAQTSPPGEASSAETLSAGHITHTAEVIQAWLVSHLSKRLKVDPQNIDVHEPLAHYGLDSVRAVSLAEELGSWLERQLAPTLAYDYPTIKALSEHLAGASRVSEANFKIGLEPGTDREPIAIIGIGCRFPGASSPKAFWQLLRDGVDAITEVPKERWNLHAFYDPNPAIPGKINTRWGGFLEQVDLFDPHFFGISPREAARMDPQQRLLLEVAWEALEDAGQVPEHLAGTRTGVFIGIASNDYGQLQFSDHSLIDAYAGTGNALSIAANRLSYLFDFRGPSIAVDTACSSSLVAVHLACSSLWNGEAVLAVAGGVNLILSPGITVNFTKAGAMAPDGRCKAFDAQANGYVRSEGAGLIVLKPLSEALAANDPIYAVIRGSAINQDGRTNGLMAPNGQAQEAVLREAYLRAGVSPGQIDYVEAHGTGTFLGDPIEAKALGTVLATDRLPEHPSAIGSVKTNIGHLEAAAGIASLIKVALSLKHHAIPPSLHFQEPNPHISFGDLLLHVQSTLEPWPNHSGQALAGVSAFGFGGTNAHVVLEEAPRDPIAPRLSDPAPNRAHLLPLSAHSPQSLQAFTKAYANMLAGEEFNAVASLPDVCYTASIHRSHHDHRLALVANTPEETAELLGAFLRGETRPGMSSGRRSAGFEHKLVFIFPGQGSQWFGMGRELLEQEPIFRTALEQCDQAMRSHVDWSLLKELTVDKTRSRLDDIEVVQPVLFAIQIGLAALWRSWGIEPDAVVGHSMGEVAAAYVAGALGLEDATRIICRRSQLLKQVSGQGAMAAVELSLEQTLSVLVGYEKHLSIAASNSPTSTVISGDPELLEVLIETLQHQDIFCRPIKVDVASHSTQMDPLRADLLQSLHGLEPQLTSLPVYSTVTGMVSDGRAFDADYWVRNLREPVLFSTAIQKLAENGHSIFLELSPHPILLSAVQQGLNHLGREGIMLPSLQREKAEQSVMLGSLGALYANGYPVDWNKLYPVGGRCLQLPSYPWHRERYWLETRETSTHSAWEQIWRSNGAKHHPLLGAHLESAHPSGGQFWEIELDKRFLPYLDDHRVQEVVVVPASAYIEMAQAAAVKIFGAGPHILKEIEFQKALFLSENTSCTVQMMLVSNTDGSTSFRVYSRPSGNKQPRATWTLHVTGKILPNQAVIPLPEHIAIEEIQAHCQEKISSSEMYVGLRRIGLHYGPCFQGVVRLWHRDGEALSQIQAPYMIKPELGSYQFHPALLDACFHALGSTLSVETSIGGRAFMPTHLGQVRFYGRPSLQMWSHVYLRTVREQNAAFVEGDIWLLDETGRVVGEVLGLRIQPIDRGVPSATAQRLGDWLHKLEWQPGTRRRAEQDRARFQLDRPGSWLIFADSSGVGEALAERLKARGDTCFIVSSGEMYKQSEPDHFWIDPTNTTNLLQLLKDTLHSSRLPCRGVLHLWSLEAVGSTEETTLASLQTAQDLGSGNVLLLVQELAKANLPDLPRLWLVTRGAQSVGGEAVSVAQAPLWGFGRVIALEHPELQCVRIDLEPGSGVDEVSLLFQELWSQDNEDQIAFRDNVRHVPRLVRMAEVSSGTSIPGAREDRGRLNIPTTSAFYLDIARPGQLDTLELQSTARLEPNAGQVEIEVCVAGLNYRDVLNAMGVYPGDPIPLGAECTGKITRLGKGVENFQVGEEVVAIAPSSFSRFVITYADLVVPRPGHLSFEEAATIPVTFLTAHYALNYLARMSKGERVLIHAAAGGVGLSAVQLAQQAGAEVFATAGSPEKRTYLQSIGVKHVMDSRSLAFAEEVIQRTEGRGVDLVLNSLPGEYIPKSVSVLAPYGRFLEIGKMDIYLNRSLDLYPFADNLSYFAIDMDRVCRQRPTLIQSLFRELIEYFEDGMLKPLPHSVFSISDAAGAFRYLAQRRNIGKVVVSLQGVESQPTHEAPITLRSDASYLITGGLGSLGLLVAQWMVQQGVRHLVLMGRKDASGATRMAIEALEKAGAQILVAQADVAREEQVASVLARIDEVMPPLRGIIHAAGVLDDGLLLNLDQERFSAVMAPKVEGAWNLHALTLNKQLDFFVLFSSAASVLGSPGQGSYAAANAFLDALAHQRRALGLPSLTINWGPWSDVGMAAHPKRSQHLTTRGMDAIAPQLGLQILTQLLLQQNTAQVVVARADWQQMIHSFYRKSELALLSQLISGQTSRLASVDSEEKKQGLTRKVLSAMEPNQREPMLISHLQKELSIVLGAEASRVDPQEPLNNLGLDSLMAIELKNRLEVDLGLAVPMVSILQNPNILQLATKLLKQLSAESVPLMETLPPRAEYGLHTEARRRITSAVSTDDWEEGEL